MKHTNVALFVVHEGCPHLCSFCNQRTISGNSKRVTPEDIHSAVKIAVASPNFAKGEGEIAFFGGSFTMIERNYMLSLLETAYEYVANGTFKGIRISTRPDGIDEEICNILSQYGVSAVELGAQSLDDRVLSLNRRGHTADDVINASNLIKKYGFELGLQMMTGLYGSGDADSIETAEKIIALHPATVRIYPTVVLEGTELCRLYENGEYLPPDVKATVSLCAKLLEMFRKANIKVIRLGLHSGGNVDEGFVAGYYHPALRELCESRIYFEMTLDALRSKGVENGTAEIYINPRELSKFVGQKRTNISSLAALGYNITVKTDEKLQEYQIYIK